MGPLARPVVGLPMGPVVRPLVRLVVRLTLDRDQAGDVVQGLLDRRGGFGAWMTARGTAGGQFKVPRMGNTGAVTRELLGWFGKGGWLA